MLKMKKELSDKVSEVDVEKLKKATENIDDVIENSLGDIRHEFDEIKNKMKGLAETQNLHKSFAELKMDVASTESGLNRRFEELQQNIELLKEEAEKYPRFEELAGQDRALRAHLEKLEAKFDVDFEKMLNEFEKLGTIFAKRSEVEMTVSEIKNAVERTEDIARELDGKHTELEKQIVVREDVADKNISDRVNEALAQMQYMFEEFQKQRKKSEDIDEEFNVIKEQIITTQNALMEMNAFLQEQMRPKY
jgi:chromosome segregation ATPase